MCDGAKTCGTCGYVKEYRLFQDTPLRHICTNVADDASCFFVFPEQPGCQDWADSEAVKKPVPVTPACERCKFSHQVTQKTTLCRINPPVLVAPNDHFDNRWGMWPEVSAFDWCGKFESRGEK